MSTRPALRTLYSWMQEVITHPDGVEAGLGTAAQKGLLPAVNTENIEETIKPSEELSGLQRIGVYSTMYFSRLIEILEEEYPALRHAVGEDPFIEFAARYLVRNPSMHWNLNQLSAKLPDFVLDDAELSDDRRWLHEIAVLERAVEVVFDAPAADGISADDVLAVPQDRWPEARLTFIPALQALPFTYPVNAYAQAVYSGEEPSPPEPGESWVMVYRPRHQVMRADLGREEHALLASLMGGASLAEALEACLALDGVDAEAVMGSVGGWFQEWAGSGVVRSVDLEQN